MRVADGPAVRRLVGPDTLAAGAVAGWIGDLPGLLRQLRDYVRFPSDGPVAEAVYPGADGRSRDEVIADFLARAPAERRAEGARVSAQAVEDLGLEEWLL
ncbi:MAG: hypothetical protein DIU70_001300 [Bacillota bacterium]